MAGAIANSLRLAKAGAVLAQHGVRFVPKGMPAPLALKVARLAVAPSASCWPFRAGQPKETRVSAR